MFRQGLCLLAGIALFASPALEAQEVDSDLLRGLRYRQIGPAQGGRVTTVTGVPSQESTFYMGTASGGLFKTTDAGESWFPVSDGQIPVGSMGSVIVADSDPNVVWVGTGSDGVRSNVSTGRGVYKSLDAGETWEFAGLYNTGQIGAVRIHPTDPNTVWVAANGDIFKPNPERGVFKTTDGGANWSQVLAVSDSTGAMDVELQPGNPDVVYAWMSRIERKPWTIISGSLEGGFYKSTDGGETFRHITNGLPNQLIGKGNLAVTAADPNRIYALIEAKPGGGVYRSDDAGESWYLASEQPQMIQRPFYYTTLGADPTDADVVYGGAEGFFKSTDGGRTFSRMPTPHGDNHDIWVNPNNGQVMVQANDGGANVSFDGGANWSTQFNQPTSELYGVWVDDQFPYRLYGAQQDDGTHIIEHTVVDGGTRNVDWFSGPGCETGPVVPHPTNEHIIYASCKGVYEVLDTRSGVRKDYRIGAESLYGKAPRDLMYRFQRVSPMEASPHDPDVLYYGSQYVHRTRDLGVTWEQISPDLTWFPDCCQDPSGEPITLDGTGEEFFSTTYQIRESLHEPGVIWVGANDGPFHITRDNGRTWTDITPDGLELGGRVQIIEPSPHRPGSAYYATHRYLMGDYAPYLYKTEDYGETWTLLTDGTNGIAADEPVRVVREDPDREGLLYVGTEFGMHVSFDNGETFQSFQLNMPNVPINDMKVHRKDLLIATQGRAFWAFDNLSSLHQMTEQTRSQEVQLYTPRDGYRTRVRPDLLGPMIEYYLPSTPVGDVEIAIADARGNIVNRYSGSATPAGRTAAGYDPDEAMLVGRQRPGGRGARGGFGGGRGGGGGSAGVSAEPGHNRFVWNVRHENGLAMPPGRYEARLSVGGQSWSAPFNVLIDPNVAAGGVTVEGLVELYEHNLKVLELVADARALAERVEEAQESFEGQSGQMADEVNQIAFEVLGESVRYGQPGLVTQITYLSRVTQGSEVTLGRDAVLRYEVLRSELDAMIERVDDVLGG